MRWLISAATLVAAFLPPAPTSAQPKTPPSITTLAIVPDGQTILVGSQAGVSLRGRNFKETATLPTKLDHVLCLAFSPDGKILAIGGGRPAESGTVEFWSWPEQKLLRFIEGHTDLIHDIAWLPDGKSLATASADRSVRVWDVGAEKPRLTLEGHSGPVLCLVCLPDGKSLCSGSADQTIRVWSTANGGLLRSLDNHLGPVQSLAVRPAKDQDAPVTLASASTDSTVRIWQPTIGRLVRIIRHAAPVYCVTWNSDGSQLVSAGKDGTVRTIEGDSDKMLSERLVSKGWIVSMTRNMASGELVLGTTLGETQVIPFPFQLSN